ncbi:glutamine amidotransferase-related protein [Pontimicrobium aquaticum]|uniref:GMP synthase n=1 Tax=Pontimicrobium aquaticum TaxID=2565367 RepID=A0A4U0F4Q3_9FLAO|nr:gamma-glutamyl-gamma-aminobutyrate hydrolase family protein [Pontimicrobium aquaticum]TJY37782.1 GMP synthase [Pontimicrobium aquaticum]
MVKIHFIIHEVFEGPGAFNNWAITRGCEVSCTRIYNNEKLPQSIDTLDLLVVLGGPQCPTTKKTECSYFDSQSEIAFIKKCINTGKAVLGVCLGAQLIGEALGAPFEKSPNPEIGVFPIVKTEEGKQNEKFSHFPEEVTVGHWHNDMPGLTDNSKIIAFSDGCPRQIVEYSELVYGFQCHLEFNNESIESIISNSTEELKSLEGNKHIQNPKQLMAHDYQEMNNLLFIFLDKLTCQYMKNIKNELKTKHY